MQRVGGVTKSQITLMGGRGSQNRRYILTPFGGPIPIENDSPLSSGEYGIFQVPVKVVGLMRKSRIIIDIFINSYQPIIKCKN